MIARRHVLTVILAIGLLGVSPGADGQQSTKVPRIGWLSVTSPSPSFSHLLEAFSQGLRDLGYVEGRTIAIDYRWAEGTPERLPALAAELLDLKVDVIMTPNPPAALAAKQATTSVPIVMLGSIDPVKSGLVASLARPGGNITGLSASAGPEIVGKYLELLREVIPGLSRVAVLRNPTNPDHPEMWKQVDRAARALSVQPQVLEARNPGDLEAAFAAMSRGRAEALVVLGDVTFFRHAARIADLAAKSRLPTISSNRELAAAGFLMSYGRDLTYAFRRGAIYVDRILKGAKPGDLPVEQPTKFEIVINMKTAKAIGLTIPPAMRARADQIIE